MSGPTTALLIADPIEVLLSAALIRAAMAVQDGYRASAELSAQHQSDHNKTLAQQQNAARQRQETVQQLMQQAETEFSQLLALSQRLGLEQRIQSGRPVYKNDDPGSDLLALQSYNSSIKAILLTQAASHAENDRWTNASTISPNFQGVVAAHEADSDTSSDIERMLARIAHLGPTPQPINNLVTQLAQSLPKDRAELLKHELRLQIQRHLETSQQQQVEQASALILRQSLIDLGYQVQEFSDTLFVDGGVVHFRKHEWGDYMVRLRFNEKTHTANFNVVRAVRDDSNQRSVLDHLAEDRWCAEFPALLKAMGARGLEVNVTRRLGAGEVPVQLVDASQLPNFPNEEQRHSDQPLKAREIK
jgi:hypothetical protein